MNSNRNVNRNVDIDRDIDIDVDVDHRHGGCCYHDNNGWGVAAAVATTAVVTAAVVGSTVNTLPPACTVVMVNGMTYQQCGHGVVPAAVRRDDDQLRRHQRAAVIGLAWPGGTVRFHTVPPGSPRREDGRAAGPVVEGRG